jgi:dihydroorotase-like cyclic amidohydrolase
VRGYDARYKVNPPLRRDEDVQAVREGLADGTIDIVATDHAPHPTRRSRASGRPPPTAWSASNPRCASCTRRWCRPGC